MLDLGTVSIEWGTLIFQLAAILILVGVPVGIILFLVARPKRKLRLADLEKRIERLERESERNN